MTAPTNEELAERLRWISGEYDLPAADHVTLRAAAARLTESGASPFHTQANERAVAHIADLLDDRDDIATEVQHLLGAKEGETLLQTAHRFADAARRLAEIYRTHIGSTFRRTPEGDAAAATIERMGKETT